MLIYSRSGLNVICAFQTSSLSLLFLASVVGIVVKVITGLREGCTETVMPISIKF